MNETLAFIFVWGLAAGALIMLIVGIIMGIKSGGVSKENPAQELKRQTQLLQRQSEILDRNRMEAWSKPDYFDSNKK